LVPGNAGPEHEHYADHRAQSSARLRPGTSVGAGWADSSLTEHKITELTALMKTRLKRMQ
jgi:hypothetical protein